MCNDRERPPCAVDVSAVVPTRDRPDALARCLAALASQDLKGLEVVVVDDGSRDRGAVEAAVAEHPGALLVRTPGRGPATARNLGIHAASGEIVCLADDDCEPAAGWVRTLVTAVGTAPGQMAAGRTVAPAGAGAAVTASQAITNHLVLKSLRGRTLGFAPTCNLGGARDLFTSLPFDPSYPDAAGEDRDWWARALAAGIEARYEPAAVVVHHQNLGVRGFLRQQLRYGRGAARFRRGRGGERGYEGPGFYTGLVKAGFREGAAAGALVTAAQVTAAAGVAVERFTALGGGGDWS